MNIRMPHMNNINWQIWLCFLIIAFFSGLSLLSAQENGRRKILVIHSYHITYSWTDNITRGIQSVLKEQDEIFDVQIEFLDSKQSFDVNYQRMLHDMFLHKYKNKRVDLIICSDDDALTFLVDYRDEIFGEIPVVFCGVNNFPPDRLKNKTNITGILEKVDIRQSIQLSLSLNPKLRKLYVVADNTTTGKELSEQTQQIARDFFPDIEFEYLNELPLQGIFEVISNAPRNAAVLFLPYTTETSGRVFEMEKIVQFISDRAAIPTYSLWDFIFGHGIVGGAILSGYRQGEESARIGIRILNGEPASSVPVTKESPIDLTVDYQIAKRYQLQTQNLSQEVIIVNPNAGFFEKNRNIVLLFSILLTITVGVFVGIFYSQRKKKKQLQKEIHFQQSLIDSLPIPIYFTDIQKYFIGANKAFYKLAGKKPQYFTHKNIRDIIGQEAEYSLFPEDLTTGETGKTRAFETEIYDSLGVKRNVIYYNSTYTDYQGMPKGNISAIADITEQKNLIKKLEESESIFELTLRATKDGIYDWMFENNQVFYSPNWAKMLGYEANELQQHFTTWLNLLHPEDKIKSAKRLKQALRRRQKSFIAEFRLKCKDGSYKWLLSEGHISYSDKGKAYRVTGAHRDIHETKSILLELQQMGELFNHTRLGVAICSPQTFTLIKLNKAFAQLHHYPAEELEGKTIHALFAPEELEYCNKNLKIAEKKIHHSWESVHITKDGNRIPIMADISNVLNKKGKIKYSIINLQDITERKYTEKEIQAQSQFIRNVMETSPIGIVVLNPDGEFVYANTTAEKILEINKETLSTRLYNSPEWEMSDFYGQALPDNKLPFYLAKKNKKPVYNIEYAINVSGLRKKFLLVNAAPILTEDQKVSAIVTTFEDITYRKHLEEEKSQLLAQEQSLNEELRTNEEELLQNLQQTIRLNEVVAESERKFQTFLNSSEDIIFLKDNDGRYIFVNEPFCEYLQLKFEFITGKTDEMLLPRKLLEISRQTDKEVIGKQSIVSKEFQILNQIFELKKFPVDFANNKTGIGGFMRNITKKKEVETKVLENEVRLKTLLENAVDSILILNEKKQITYFTGAIEPIFDISPATLTNKSFLEILNTQDSKSIEETINQIVQIPDKAISISYKNHPEGKDPKYLQSIFVNYLRNPLISGILATTRNISDQTQSEELRKNIEVARRAAQAKQQFLANMSHEIRTPMNGILGMTDFLSRTSLDTTQQDYVKTIKSSAESLLNIINDILDLSKIEAGKMPIKPGLIETNELVYNLEKMFDALKNSKNIQFVKNLSDTLPEFFISDPVRINQVFLNLISNGIKFTQQGSITLNLSLKERASNQCTIYAEIIDTGIGISEENQKKLFSAFSQVDSSLIRSSEGTGLGLAISKKIVNLLGGDIGLESMPGKGSKFWFTFQAGIASAPIKSPQSDSILKAGQTKFDASILLVEDKFVNQKVITIMLESLGCKVWIAENGKKAFEMIKAEAHDAGDPNTVPYDLIFMDIQMPVMDGITATRLIRDTFTGIPPIVGLSANALEGDAEKYISLGMDDYISKPVKSEVLADKLKLWVTKESKPSEDISKSINKLRLDLSQTAIINKEALKVIVHQSRYNHKLIEEVFIAFLFEGHALFEKLKNEIITNNYMDAESTIDNLMGISLTMGAQRIETVCNFLLSANELKDQHLCMAALPVLLNCIDEYHQEISSEIVV